MATLNVLQTSDWHLGGSLDASGRPEEFQSFLNWLLDLLHQRPCDALLVCGNIFHTATPGPDDLRRLFGFLAAAARIVPRIVLLGGQRDPASLLEAPGDLFEALGVRAIADPGPQPGRSPRALIPLCGADGQPRAVVAALPFVHALQLGVRPSGLDPAERRAQLADAFAEIWRQLADQASETHPDLPLIACGHTLCQGLDEASDAQDPLRPPLRIFDPRFVHVALGASASAASLDGGRIHYSGSPLPMTVEAADAPRRVLRLSIDGHHVAVEPVEVPLWRQVVTLSGTLPELVGRLVSLTSELPLSPLLCLDVVGEPAGTDIETPIQGALARLPAARRPALLRLSLSPTPRPNLDAPTGLMLDPEAVFCQLVRERTGQDPDDPLLDAFRLLVEADLPDQDLSS